MESYVLTGISLSAWLVTFVVVKGMMRTAECGSLIGGLAGLVTAAAAGGAYWSHLSSVTL